MSSHDPQYHVDEATFQFTLGEIDAALATLDHAFALDADYLPAWHARAEILFAARRLDEALVAAERCLAQAADDVHIHTTLSRIHMERGDKATAEHHGTRARILGWRDQLQEKND
jgi:tetratricopeptide (TPR) repeat protein